MYLTTTNLVHYLVSRGLVSRESVVDGNFWIAEVAGHNRNFKFVHQSAPSLFVKQLEVFDERNVECLRTEAACYRLAWQDSRHAALSGIMPRFVGYDESRHVVIVELLRDCEDLLQRHRRLEHVPVESGRMLGQGLGECHRATVGLMDANADASLLAQRAAWVLSIHLGEDGPQSSANDQLLAMIRKSSDLTDALDRLREGWSRQCLIHGDIKWSNCIVYRGGDDRLEYRFVDWEMADLGDPAWDVGTVMQSFWSYCVFSETIGEEVTVEQFLHTAAPLLETLFPALQEVWRTYCSTSQFASPSEREFLLRCVRYAAARLIQTSYEYMHNSPTLTGNALMLFQLSRWVVNNPDQAITKLLGL